MRHPCLKAVLEHLISTLLKIQTLGAIMPSSINGMPEKVPSDSAALVSAERSKGDMPPATSRA